MKKPPLAVTILSCLFIATGAIGFIVHLLDYRAQHHFGYDSIWILGLRALAVVCGIFMLRGSNWARWVTILWLAFHVGISAFNSIQQTFVHLLFLALFAYFLFRADAGNYFQSGTSSPNAKKA